MRWSRCSASRRCPLNKSRLPNLCIASDYLNTFDPGNRYSEPYAYTLTQICYNSEKICKLASPVKSWAVIFEPRYLEKVKGRISVLDSHCRVLSRIWTEILLR
jgi:spermidine/putrescine transport system substrate-binding protein